MAPFTPHPNGSGYQHAKLYSLDIPKPRFTSVQGRSNEPLISSQSLAALIDFTYDNDHTRVPILPSPAPEVSRPEQQQQRQQSQQQSQSQSQPQRRFPDALHQFYPSRLHSLPTQSAVTTSSQQTPQQMPQQPQKPTYHIKAPSARRYHLTPYPNQHGLQELPQPQTQSCTLQNQAYLSMLAQQQQLPPHLTRPRPLMAPQGNSALPQQVQYPSRSTHFLGQLGQMVSQPTQSPSYSQYWSQQGQYHVLSGPTPSQYSLVEQHLARQPIYPSKLGPSAVPLASTAPRASTPQGQWPPYQGQPQAPQTQSQASQTIPSASSPPRGSYQAGVVPVALNASPWKPLTKTASPAASRVYSNSYFPPGSSQPHGLPDPTPSSQQIPHYDGTGRDEDGRFRNLAAAAAAALAGLPESSPPVQQPLQPPQHDHAAAPLAALSQPLGTAEGAAASSTAPVTNAAPSPEVRLQTHTPTIGPSSSLATVYYNTAPRSTLTSKAASTSQVSSPKPPPITTTSIPSITTYHNTSATVAPSFNAALPPKIPSKPLPATTTPFLPPRTTYSTTPLPPTATNATATPPRKKSRRVSDDPNPYMCHIPTCHQPFVTASGLRSHYLNFHRLARSGPQSKYKYRKTELIGMGVGTAATSRIRKVISNEMGRTSGGAMRTFYRGDEDAGAEGLGQGQGQGQTANTLPLEGEGKEGSRAEMWNGMHGVLVPATGYYTGHQFVEPLVRDDIRTSEMNAPAKRIHEEMAESDLRGYAYADAYADADADEEKENGEVKPVKRVCARLMGRCCRR